MKIEINVIKSESQVRELVSKEGVRSSHNICHIIGVHDSDVVDCKCYDPKFPLPEQGKRIEVDINKYECYGGVASCSISSEYCIVKK